MSRRTRKNVGVIGLGIIGSRVVDVLRRKGFHVFVWNRTPRPIPNFVGAPAELAEMCDYVQIFVSDDDALDFVVKQLSPGLAARHTVIAHSTVSPASMTAVAEVVERRGARFLEAPFTGSKEAAEKGELVYYVGGDEAAIKDARPVLEASSKQVLEIGEVGQATAIKLATNMVTAATVQAAAEALALVHAVGVPTEIFAAAMKGNASNSTTLSMKLPKMMQRKFDPHFSVKHMLKDMQIASRLGLSHHLELAVSSAARDRLLEQLQSGHGDEDYSAIIRKFFPDVPEPTADQSDLELFQSREKPAEPVAPPAEQSTTPAAGSQTPVAASAVAVSPNVSAPEWGHQSVPEAAKPPTPEPALATAPSNAPEVFPHHLMPTSFPAAPTAVHPENETNGGGTLVEEAGEEFSGEPTENEPIRQRGFLSRLLRR
jgi:3-hydroxyisobutyrate dehydrogenase-like beta-hydroxyacid dehydrogenase